MLVMRVETQLRRERRQRGGDREGVSFGGAESTEECRGAGRDGERMDSGDRWARKELGDTSQRTPWRLFPSIAPLSQERWGQAEG